MKRLLIVDTFNLLFRSYYAMRHFKSPDGAPNGMLMGLARALEGLCDATYTGVVFATDCGASFRNELLPTYKANRKELEPELRAQIPIALNMLASAGYALIERQNYEADDVIASIAKSANEYDEVVIYSTDKDLFSLINERVCIMGKDNEIYKEAQCIEKFGVRPNQIRDYLALIGDSADNFKGVPGIGPAAAKRLLNEFNDLEGIYEHINVAGTKGLIAKLEAGKESALLSQKLATLVDDLDMSAALENAQKDFKELFARLEPEFAKWGLFKYQRMAANYAASYVSDFNKATNEEDKKQINEPNNASNKLFSAELITSDEQLLKIVDALPARIGFDTETTGLERNARCVGFSFAAKLDNELKAFYVPLAHIGANNISAKAARAALLKLFSRTVIGHNLAFDFKVVAHNFATPLPNKFIDSMVLAWLANSSEKIGLDYQSTKLFKHTNVAFSNLVPKGSHFGELDPAKAYFYAAEDAAMTYLIAEYYEANLDASELRAASVEMRFLKVLFNMSEKGISASAKKLKEIKELLVAKVKELSEQIISLANRDFNIASPKQLAEVLYDDLGLKAPKNRSTAEDILKTLEHAIIAPILEYRSAAKMLNTYVEPLLKLAGRANDEFIIHAQFNQTGTATGRISCQQPNLQNIPARTEWASMIKSAFKAREGFSFISLDYSQIELRMLAHFSGDEALCNAFLSGADIHAQTAIECFGDASKRQLAKAINFGLIYGMGARSLAAELGISTALAKEYIDKYFAKFSAVQGFFSATINYAREHGYIRTLAGRKRYFNYGDGARSDAAHDRECINSVLQGSAADLIKNAMNKASELLSEDAFMLLQIHDELIFEVKDELASEFASKIAAIMQNAAALRVPLVTSCAIGKSLAELK